MIVRSSFALPTLPRVPALPLALILALALALLALLAASPAQLLAALPTRADPAAHRRLLPLDPADSLAYRYHLERTTSPRAQVVHSPTLTFDSIYVLSLPSRQDRRDQIQKLAAALGWKVRFVDAVDKSEPFIKWIAERVAEAREQKIALFAKHRGVAPSSIGGLSIPTVWLDPSPSLTSPVPFPPLDLPLFPASGPSWVDHLESTPRHLLRPDNPDLNITALLHDPNELIPGRQVNDGTISTFWGHTRAMKEMLRNGDHSALVLEDDVDVEWDIERLWSRMERKLPPEWEMAFLGHCWGKELTEPYYLHPHLHQSTVPLCLHAYALTAPGASHLLSLLLSPWTAFCTAVDTAVPSYISQRRFPHAFSVEPPLVIQRKELKSDIQEGIGSVWKGLLMDSTVDRIRADEGEAVLPDVWDPDHHDPATVFRYGKGNYRPQPCPPNAPVDVPVPPKPQPLRAAAPAP